MAKVVADMSMSLDGFVADQADEIKHLFGWFGNGDVTLPTASPYVTFQVTEASAAHLRDGLDNVGALICGRRVFDLSHGWGGTHPMGVPVFVVTHSVPDGWPLDDAPMTFVTDGIESALEQAKAAAGDKHVAIATANLAQQYLNAGLLDEIRISLIPVLLGDGIPFFANLNDAPIELDGPQVIEGTGVTHLYYQVHNS